MNEIQIVILISRFIIPRVCTNPGQSITPCLSGCPTEHHPSVNLNPTFDCNYKHCIPSKSSHKNTSSKMQLATKCFLVVLAVLVWNSQEGSSELSVSSILDYTVRQYAILSERIQGEERIISTGDPLNPTWNLKDAGDWTVGFYGGTLWMLYKLTQDAYWKNLALEFQEKIKHRQDDTGTHDVGFIIMSTYGLALELTGNMSYAPIIQKAAESLATRYVAPAEVLRSWNGGNANEVLVIADNMMNLELLLVASKLNNFNPSYTNMVLSHSRKTRENHFRDDGSVYHVVAFHDQFGYVIRKYNVQGYNDESAWTRGLAWVINGYTTVFENIIASDADLEYLLECAELAANFFITNLSDDNIPWYDFRAPIDTEYSPKDTSAGAVAAHGFLKLFKITGKSVYFETAEKIMEALISPPYRADSDPRYRLPAIFVNGTVHFHAGDLNTAIVYGDFYFLRALDLYIDIVGSKFPSK